MKSLSMCSLCKTFWKILPAYLFFTFSALAGLSSVALAMPTGDGGGAQEDSRPLSQNEAPAEISSGAYGYLRTYGYIVQENPQASTVRRLEDYRSAIRSFQTFFGLPVTGQMDSETNRLMSLPRCGVPDVVRDNSFTGQTRQKRFVHSGERWENNEVTYRILNFSPDLTEAQATDAIRSAFKVWSDVTLLTFRQVSSGQADINIKFAAYDHGDGYSFDGLGGTLAHAYFPGEGLGGDAHFDESELFTLRSNEGTDLFTVAAHEFGHSLGLGHSSEFSALMAPFYQGYDESFRLAYDDLIGIQSIYGVNPNPPVSFTRSPVVPRPTPDPDSDRCDRGFNAVAFIRGEIFLFKGKNFWRMQEQGKPLEGYPVEIGTFWTGLPSRIDAAYERYDGKLIFMKGSEYWVYNGVQMEYGYPQQISDLGLPGDMDGALPWGQTGKTYFFKDDLYYRFDEFENRVDPGYPRPIKDSWLGVPTNIDAVFRHYDGDSWATYFIRNKRYWRFDESRSQVDIGYPKNFAVDWMDCKDDSADKAAPKLDQLRATKMAPTDKPSTTDSGSAPIARASTICVCVLSMLSLRLIYRWH